jgi:hypothetical protein
MNPAAKNNAFMQPDDYPERARAGQAPTGGSA